MAEKHVSYRAIDDSLLPRNGLRLWEVGYASLESAADRCEGAAQKSWAAGDGRGEIDTVGQRARFVVDKRDLGT